MFDVFCCDACVLWVYMFFCLRWILLHEYMVALRGTILAGIDFSDHCS